MNNHLKGILAGSFILLLALLLMSKCSSCRQQPELAQAPQNPEPQPIELIDEDPAPEPEPEPEPQPEPEPEPDPEPEPEPQPEPEPIEVRTDEGQDGEIRVTIEWDFPGDVDLHVTEPSGNEINYTNMRNNLTGGFLDVDNREGGTRYNTAVENVFWSNPANGRYIVDLVMFRMSDQAPNGGYVNIRIKNGASVQTYRARLTQRGQRVRVDTFNYVRP